VITEAIAIVAWPLYASLEGVREGLYWHYKNKEDNPYHKEHILWSVQRVIVMILMAVAIENPLFPIYAALCFPFWHDGAYYSKRESLSPGTYPRGFIDHSKTSQAIMTKYFPPTVRIICAIIAKSIAVAILLHA